jgi:hypothetical protein
MAKINYTSIEQYGRRLGVGKPRAHELIKRLPEQYKLCWPSGRVAMIRADAPDLRKPAGRPRQTKQRLCQCCLTRNSENVSLGKS